MNTPEKITIPVGTVHWCACGLSKNYPFCDGSHKGTDKTPIGEIIDVPKDVYICKCGKTDNTPFCNGNHKNIASE